MKDKKKIIIFYVIISIITFVLLLITYKQLSYKNPSNYSYKLFNIVTIVLTIISIGITSVIYFCKKISAEKIFLLVVPFLAITFMFLMPPFTSHDETHHWVRVYEISEGHFITPIKKDTISSKLPYSVVKNVNKKYSKIRYLDIQHFLNVKLDSDNRTTTDMSTVAIYSPVQYIPQALGVFIARLFTDKLFILVYSARLFNILFCIFILYKAIKIMPIGKKVMLFPLMLPITIEGIASMSADGFTNSIAFLFIAYIFREIYSKEKIKKSTIAILCILSILLALTKIVYIPLVLLLFLIPKEKFSSNKKKILVFSLIAFISILINASWLVFANKTYLSISSGGDSSSKIHYVLYNMFDYLKLVLVTINQNLQRYISILFGSVLGWKEFPIYYIVTYSFFLFFLFISITDNTLKDKMSNKIVIMSLIIILLVLGLIFTSLYVQYVKNTLGVKTIYGIQGRYFIPILPLISILLSKLKIKTEYKEDSIYKFMGIMTTMLYIYVFLTIVTVHI